MIQDVQRKTEDFVPRLPRKIEARSAGAQRTPEDARAYIRPLAKHQVLHLPRKDEGQNTKCRAWHAKVLHLPRKIEAHAPCKASSAAPATQKPRTERQNTKCRACHAKVLHLRHKIEAHAPCAAPSTTPATQNPSTRPLEEPEVQRLPRKMQAQRPGAQGTPGGTPGRTSDPLESLKCHACHAKCKHR